MRAQKFRFFVYLYTPFRVPDDVYRDLNRYFDISFGAITEDWSDEENPFKYTNSTMRLCKQSDFGTD